MLLPLLQLLHVELVALFSTEFSSRHNQRCLNTVAVEDFLAWSSAAGGCCFVVIAAEAVAEAAVAFDAFGRVASEVDTYFTGLRGPSSSQPARLKCYCG